MDPPEEPQDTSAGITPDTQNQTVQLGTLNIIDARATRLEAAIWSVKQMNVDIGINL